MNCNCKNYVPVEKTPEHPEEKQKYKVGDWVYFEHCKKLVKVKESYERYITTEGGGHNIDAVRPVVPADFVGGMFAWEYTNKYRHTGRDILTVNGIDGGRLCVENAYGNTHSVSQSDLSPIRESDWTVEIKGLKVSAIDYNTYISICIDDGNFKKYHDYENDYKPFGLEICRALGVPVRRRV